jgi:hypothetical protein
MRTLPLVMTLIGFGFAATPFAAEARSGAGSVVVSACRTPSCGCCKGWLDHIKKAGFSVQDHVVNNLTAIKQRYRVPAALASCHTARINGSVIEGHVPLSAIEMLLKERPKAAGIAVPGMPLDSPGMESPFKRETYTVFTFTNSGVIRPFQTIKG